MMVTVVRLCLVNNADVPQSLSALHQPVHLGPIGDHARMTLALGAYVPLPLGFTGRVGLGAGLGILADGL
jgi:hypothetical protein